MKKEWFIVTGLLLIAIIGFFIYPIFKISYSPVSTRTFSSDCKAIIENSGERKANIVFLSENVNEDKAREYADYLLNSEPFSFHKEKFNFYYAGKYEDCSLYQNSILYCYSKELIKKSSVCPNDYVIVLTSRDSNIRSSSYMNVVSINIRHPKTVLLHEFAHTFANLADEYVPSVIPRGSKNCQKNCDKFEVIDSCNQGCSKDSYFRSSDSSVMRTLSTKDYRTLNTKIIEEDLLEYE